MEKQYFESENVFGFFPAEMLVGGGGGQAKKRVPIKKKPT